ncbi:MAG: hypothetical protein MMC23_009354 [Stictis urceolatum]|nr:hypothetical protein [Stictis urceolata]
MPDPLVTHIYTADPSAHVFNDRIYVYPSHDRETDIEDNDNGDQYDMNDYHVLSMDKIGSPVTDHGVALKAGDIPWVGKQLWAPDAASKNGKYYLYFPARDKEGVFRIGVAEGSSPEGPFVPDPEPIPGSYSIDPASFVDDDGQAYLYFGGIWGGQLQCWQTGRFDGDAYKTMEAAGDKPSLMPRVAKLSDDMHSFAGDVRELQLLGADGRPISADNHEHRFFEAAWMHKYNGVYYFSYSTGDTHYLVYATGDNPLGPFAYQGRILEPVVGWTTHHSIVEAHGKWYLFYHDISLGGQNHLRCVKVREIQYDAEGKIQGRSTALEFARTSPKSLKLVLTARRIDALRKLADEIAVEAGDGVKVLPLKLDVSKPSEVKGFVGSLPAEFREIDVLVNNAGLVKGVSQAPSIAEEDMNAMFATNVTGLINMTQEVLKIYKARPDGGRGDVINIGSIAGREGYPGGSIYCATKAAVRTFTDALRKELINTRIRISEIDPGQVETEFSVVRFYGDKAKADAVYANCEPLTPEDIAETIVFTAGRRENVVIADMLIYPQHQGGGLPSLIYRKPAQ